MTDAGWSSSKTAVDGGAVAQVDLVEAQAVVVRGQPGQLAHPLDGDRRRVVEVVDDVTRWPASSSCTTVCEPM